MNKKYFFGSILFLALSVFFFVYGYLRGNTGTDWLITVAAFVITTGVLLFKAFQKT